MSAINCNVKVRYSEVGAEGIVYYANYFSWYELTQYEYLTKCGLTYDELSNRGVRFVVVDIKTRFAYPVRMDDVLRVEMYVRRVNNIKVSVDFEIVRIKDNKKVASTSAVYACVGTDLKPKLINKTLPELYFALNRDVEEK